MTVQYYDCWQRIFIIEVMMGTSKKTIIRELERVQISLAEIGSKVEGELTFLHNELCDEFKTEYFERVEKLYNKLRAIEKIARDL